MSPTVELSFLKDEEQYVVLDCIECNVATLSHAQAIRLKKMSQEGTLTTDEIEDILSEEKPNQIPKMKFNADRIRNVLPKNIEEKKIETVILKNAYHILMEVLLISSLEKQKAHLHVKLQEVIVK